MQGVGEASSCSTSKGWRRSTRRTARAWATTCSRSSHAPCCGAAARGTRRRRRDRALRRAAAPGRRGARASDRPPGQRRLLAAGRPTPSAWPPRWQPTSQRRSRTCARPRRRAMRLAGAGASRWLRRRGRVGSAARVEWNVDRHIGGERSTQLRAVPARFRGTARLQAKGARATGGTVPGVARLPRARRSRDRALDAVRVDIEVCHRAHPVGAEWTHQHAVGLQRRTERGASPTPKRRCSSRRSRGRS